MINNYGYFDDRVIYMNVNMLKEVKVVYDRLIDKMNILYYIKFENRDGKDKIFYVILVLKRLKLLFYKVWECV